MDKKRFKKIAADLAAQMTTDELIGLIGYESRAVERLGVNRYCWWCEASHGVARSGVATVFPCPTSLAASFDPSLLREIGDAVATEARAKYNVYASHGEYDIYKGLTFWCPNVNIYRDPRWGRGQETFGEDPCLTSTLAVEYIKGLQGDGEFYKTSACAKHFAVHSGPESLRHEFDAKVSEKDLNETYLPAFKAAVNAGVTGVMGAYNRILGEPSCASDKLSSILFEKWGFDGYFMSDNYALDNIHDGHKYTNDAAETAALAIKHGLSLDCSFVYQDHLKEALERGLVTEDEIRRAAEKTLEIRASLGEFEKIRPYSDIDWDEVDSPKMRGLNLRAAEEGLVLLENKNAIPLNINKFKRIAVIGPNADSRAALVGNYNGRPTEYITVLDGVRRVFKDSVVRYAEGAQMITEDPMTIFGYGDMISEGVEEARRADLTIICLGLDAEHEGEESSMNNEVIAGGDRTSVGLPDTQKRLLREVLSVSDNVIVITFCGGCIDLGNEARQRLKAHIHAWYPGALGGLAIAHALAGLCDLSGRTPVTFYREDATLPDFTDYSMAHRARFADPASVLYPFGYGLSTYKYSISSVSTNENNVGFKVKNEENRVISLPIGIYTDKGDASLPERSFALCKVIRIDLAPNEEKRLNVPVSREFSLPYNHIGEQFTPGYDIRFAVK